MDNIKENSIISNTNTEDIHGTLLIPEISKKTPVTLIIQGLTDIQTTIEDAENLSKSNKKAEKVIIEKNKSHT